MKYLVLLILLTLSSCTHRVRIATKNCKTVGIYSETSASYYTLKKNIFFFGTEKEYSLNQLLNEKKVACRKVKYLNYTWKQGPLDSLVSIIPFVNQKTLEITYAFE